jgi:N-acetylglutamate synthase-like GNAT family acetyltransferase
MRIFKGHPNDIDGIVEVNEALRLGIEGEYWHTPKWVSENIDQFYIMKTNGWIYAAMSVFSRDSFCEIETLAVHDRMRKRGAGSSLVYLAKLHAKDKGFDRLVVRSFSQHDVKDFYLKQGFRLSETPFFCLGQYADEFRFYL